MRDLGRPSKLTPEIRQRIVQAISIGTHRQDAAEYAGIDAATLRRWMTRGLEETDGPYAEFRTAIVEAEARAKITAMGCITKAARAGDWKAASWWLQKKYPHQFSEQSQLFLISKAFEQIEAAADAAGTPLHESVWEAAWANVAKEFSTRLPASLGLTGALEPGTDEDELDEVDVSETDKAALMRLLRASSNGKEGGC